MARYEEAIKSLNPAQRRAVETLEGPVLVIAGPGTGKTQLLTTRAAHILAKTDTPPRGILCLTFTESAVQTMRERLGGMVGPDAYDITISTYHAFGSELIRRFPDYFTELADMRPANDLAIDQTLRGIINGLPFGNPLKFADMYLSDVKTLISEAKRALLTPEDLAKVAEHNDQFLEKASPLAGEVLEGMARVDKKSISRFAKLAEKLAAIADITQPASNVLPLSTIMLRELHEALEQAEADNSTKPLTAWKNSWLAKDDEGNFMVAGQSTNQKLRAARGIYRQYLDQLKKQNMFDYDDMILKAVRALEENADLRYTLQEQYLYIMLDEFQDTNGAQLRLVELLTDNPVNEGRPNVLAVGDDDQAIFAFQGADYSHMLKFKDMYRDVLPIPLTQNYRSYSDVLHTARGIAEQIEERLHHHFPEIEKELTAENKDLPEKAIIQRHEAKSDVAQFAWTAKRIKELIGQGTSPGEIAVLAPQHKYLEPLVPFLRREGVPVRYEKRENVLDDPAVNQLLRMAELVQALQQGAEQTASALWAEVISFPFWDIPTSLVWQLSWQASEDRRGWTDVLLEKEQLKPIALFFVRLSFMAGTETCETMLDHLIGTAPLDLQEPGFEPFTSPFFEHYFGERARQTDMGTFWHLLTNLTVLRARLRDHRAAEGEPLHIDDLLEFVRAHREADIKILNTSPYQEAEDAVQLMTAFKAKGQEFDAVFVLSCFEEAWGAKTRGAGGKIPLPQNLQFIRYGSATDNERLRLFYVAATRAKNQLYMLNYQSTYSGKLLTRMKYLQETVDEEGNVTSPLLPENSQTVLTAEDGAEPATELAAYWQQRHQAALNETDLRTLLLERLERFQLSPTHVNSFTDLQRQGPEHFLLNTILRFPQAPTPAGAFGSAMHETLEWIHLYNRREDHLPDKTSTAKDFEHRLRMQGLSEHDTQQYLERGKTALNAYLSQRADTISKDNEHEYNFRPEGVFIGEAHMGGKIDKLVIDKTGKTIHIVDFKTGKSYQRWHKDARMHRYRQQLYLYKALVEGSHTFKNYTVTGASLEFVESDEQGRIRELPLHFDPEEEKHIRQLTQAIWGRIKNLDLPDTSQYTQDMNGIESFERDLLQ